MLFKVKSQGRGAWRPIQNTKLGKWNSGLGSNFYPAKENSIVSNWQSRNSLNAQSVTNKTPFIKPLSSGKWNVESSLSNEVLDFDKYPENSNSDLGNVKYSKSSDTDNNKPNYSSAWGGQNDVLAWNSNKNSNDANYDGAKWESKQSKNNRKNKWDLNESKDNKPKKEKVSNTKTTMGLSNWGTTTTTPSYDSFVDEKPYKNQFGGQSNSFNTKNKKNGNSAFKDTSILDELDKNDWYLETSSNVKIPEIIADSNVNIDVRELWDFDKRRGLTANFGRSSKRRRNRHVESSKCECVDVNLCNEEDIIMDERTAETDDWRQV